MVMLGVGCVSLSVIGALLGTGEGIALLTGIGAGGLVAAAAFMMKRGAGRKCEVVVSGATLTLGARTIARSGVRATVCSWKQPHLWTVLGTALVLEGRDGKISLGGTGHLPPRSGLPVVTRVDAALTATDFVALGRELDLLRELTLPGTPSEERQIDVAPARTGARGALPVMLPWIATMGLVALLGAAAPALGVEENPAALAVLAALTLAIVVGGLVVTSRTSARPPKSRHRLRIGRAGLSVAHAGDSEGEAAWRHVPPEVVERVAYRYSTRWGTYEFPALSLPADGLPGRRLVVGVWDPAQAWGGPVARTRRLDGLVGPDEWALVLGAIGLSSPQAACSAERPETR
jgi:hypothetical protein